MEALGKLAVDFVRREVLKNYERDLINTAPGVNIECHGTSIWDETLFKARRRRIGSAAGIQV